jgi:HTH-type transcriptional regulator/antitoxin HipB
MIHPIRATGQLGPILKQLRQARKWTQGELGSRVGLSQERISAIEKNPESVSLDRLLSIMLALDARLEVVTADATQEQTQRGTSKSGRTTKESW